MKTEYIECYRKTDKNGKFYYIEKWIESTYNRETVDFEHKTLHSGRCSKATFEERMARTKYIHKTSDKIVFEN